MTDVANFADILDMPATEIERPKPIPTGTYIAMVQGMPRFDKSAKKQTPFYEFTLKLLEAQDDVDADALSAMGGIADKTMRLTFYITEASVWRLKEFLETLGIDLDGSTLRAGVEEAPGKQCGIYVRHVPNQDGTGFFAEIGKTLRVE
ncbi:MAG: hypothetical protein KGL39_50525 [Patescibacteria group bacterium]|nr:hypothetical protein [Patescibacteria group bacterium]